MFAIFPFSYNKNSQPRIKHFFHAAYKISHQIINMSKLHNQTKYIIIAVVAAYISLLTLFQLLPLTGLVSLPTVGGNSDSWGTVLNNYLTSLAGANATALNQTM